VRLRPHTLRARLALVFALVTVVVSVSVGAFVLLRYRADLSTQINEDLETRFDDVSGELRNPPERENPQTNRLLIPKAETFAQVLNSDGTVVTATPRALQDDPLLSPHQRATALQKSVRLDRAVPPHASDARLLAGPARFHGRRVVVVVGTPLGDREHAANQLARTLAIAIPALAAIVIAAGWFIVGAALRPMRAMVSEADALSVARRGRLTEPNTAELAELSRHLNDMLDRIEAALEHERAFVDDASHELRTPIAIARGELELARPITTGSPAVREAVDSALEEVLRLQALATNLLVLARTRAAGPPSGTRVELRTVCEHAIESVRRARDLDGLDVTLQGDAEAVGDEVSLERAITNLVDNAVRHARHRAAVVVGRHNGAAVVEVRDDGAGFPPAVVDRARERFVPGGHGAGLGLAIVDAIASAHGGELALENDEEGGAVARLELMAP
jgi:signal transduction histidine kinase